MKLKNYKYLVFAVFFSFSLVSCVGQQYHKPAKVTVVKKSEGNSTPFPSQPSNNQTNTNNLPLNLPEINREFRAAWVATVANINWPSRKNLSTEDQKQEALKILDLLHNANFNAVIFQVRPAADALYKSSLEPWSCYLTGETGKCPVPFYDPLEFWIDEAHKRGMELHVWLNPYRAHHLSAGSVNSESMVRKSPSNIVKLKNGMYWFDPASSKTQNHVSNVVKDIVTRYDIDGVHFDDYFYPYPSYNGGADFPDYESWNNYKNNNGTLSKADWRRDHVNKFIERINKEIKQTKPYVKFGISPFGIWKSGYPAGVVGSSQFDELYADAKLWLNKGWIDYFSPQLYWPINSKRQNFQDLLEWWQSENTLNRHLWPGLNTVEVNAPNKATEIVNQLKIAQNVLNKNNLGAIHYSVAGLTNNSEMTAALKNGPYKQKAIIPMCPWLKSTPLDTPNLQLQNTGNNTVAQWNTTNNSNVFQWVLYSKYGNTWHYDIYPKQQTNATIPLIKNGENCTTLVLKAFDRLGNESQAVVKKI